MVQLPAPTNVAVLPDTEQTVLGEAAKLTASPELAVALSARGVPTVCVGMAAKLMVCAVGVVTTWNELLTFAAAV